MSQQQSKVSSEESAQHIAHQLERLAAMRHAAARLMARDRLGRDFFSRGMPESVSFRTTGDDFKDLLYAYYTVRYRPQIKNDQCVERLSDDDDPQGEFPFFDRH